MVSVRLEIERVIDADHTRRADAESAAGIIGERIGDRVALGVHGADSAHHAANRDVLFHRRREKQIKLWILVHITHGDRETLAVGIALLIRHPDGHIVARIGLVIERAVDLDHSVLVDPEPPAGVIGQREGQIFALRIRR